MQKLNCRLGNTIVNNYLMQLFRMIVMDFFAKGTYHFFYKT